MDKNGGPAFPAHDYIVGDLSRDQFQKLGESRGMSLRDYFAAVGLQGMLAGTPGAEFGAIDAQVAAFMANEAYILADAMLKAREAK